MQRSKFSVIAINSRSVYEGLLVAAVRAYNLLAIYWLEGFSEEFIYKELYIEAINL